MTRTLPLLIALLALFSCGNGTRRGSDGYMFDRKEWDRSQVTLVVVEHPSRSDLIRAASDAGVDVNASGPVLAWSRVYRDPANQCEIHVLDPMVRHAPERIGHEVMHCLYGRWHD